MADDDELFAVRGKVVVVTGGARGIGKMIAEGFVRRGAKVYISSRKVEACAATAKMLNAIGGGGRCISQPEDISTNAGCVSLAKAISANESKVHVLVNNSGTSWGQTFEDYSEEGWSKVNALNLVAPFQLTRALLHLLDAGSTPSDPSRVIMIGSISGITHQPFPTYAYDTSKAALHLLTRKLAAEFANRPGGKKITVNAIAPGFVPTAMSAQLASYSSTIESTIPLGRWGNEDDMAGAAIFLSGKSGAWVTGAILPIDGGQLTTAIACRL